MDNLKAKIRDLERKGYYSLANVSSDCFGDELEILNEYGYCCHIDEMSQRMILDFKSIPMKRLDLDERDREVKMYDVVVLLRRYKFSNMCLESDIPYIDSLIKRFGGDEK
jgi:hypothetical protein